MMVDMIDNVMVDMIDDKTDDMMVETIDDMMVDVIGARPNADNQTGYQQQDVPVTIFPGQVECLQSCLMLAAMPLMQTLTIVQSCGRIHHNDFNAQLLSSQVLLLSSAHQIYQVGVLLHTADLPSQFSCVAC